MNCVACGQGLPEGTAFCARCGARATAVSAGLASALEDHSDVRPAQRVALERDDSAPTSLRGPSDGERLSALNGVGGWLALFCFGVMLTFVLTFVSFVARPDPLTAVALGVGVLALVTGIALVRRSTRALWMVKTLLWLEFWIGVAVVLAGALIGGSRLVADGMEGLVGSSIWLAYFARSRRVRVTFGCNLATWTSPAGTSAGGEDRLAGPQD